jgi:FMN phosphatase YigB (HAD superfamily)
MLESLYAIYTSELKPGINIGAKEFLLWASQFWKLFIISDTYTLPGSILDRILQIDGICDIFAGRYYSDQLGVEKPNTMAIEKIICEANVRPEFIIHIGDLISKDYELCRRTGAKFILFADDKNNQREDSLSPTIYIGKCKNFQDLLQFMEKHAETNRPT